MSDDTNGKMGQGPFGEDTDEECQIALNRFFDALIELAQHYRGHHKSEESTTIISIGLLLAPAASPIMGITMSKDLIQRLAERGYSEEFTEASETMMKNGGMTQGLLGLTLMAARQAVENGDIVVEGQGTQGANSTSEHEETVPVEDLPSWLRNVLIEVQQQPEIEERD